MIPWLQGHVPLLERQPVTRGGGDARIPADLRELARGAVRAALLAERRGQRMDTEVRPLLRLTCDVAREDDTMVERVLVVIKEVWREQPDARPRRNSDAEDALARVITLCIEEYYAPRELS